MKIAFVSDSGTGKDAKTLMQDGIYSVPLQIADGEETFHDLEDITVDEVYDRMRDGHMLTTSLPSLGKIDALFQQCKADGYDMIFAVPICSGLSSTINAMQICAESLDIAFDYVDCHVTAVVQEYLIRYAKQLHEAGMQLPMIKARLKEVVHTTNTLLLPNDLQHLRRGGRLTPFAATLGGLLKIKPILQINEQTKGKIDVADKVRTMHRAMDKAIAMMKQDGVDECYDITVAHADDEEEGLILANKLKEAFPGAEHHMIKLVSVVGIHTGRGCQAIQYFKKTWD